ncbi:hypothetical protein MRX96_007767 [Rhipicephalus microplus]
MESADPAKNGELEIVPGAPVYVPAIRVTINPPDWKGVSQAAKILRGIAQAGRDSEAAQRKVYFTPEVDIFLIRPVLAVDPFEDGSKWPAIARNLSAVLLRNVVAGAFRHELCREHLTSITKSRLCMESADPAKNWELEIVPGATVYVPAIRVTINPPIGRACRKRRRFYEELLKQAVIREQKALPERAGA